MIEQSALEMFQEVMHLEEELRVASRCMLNMMNVMGWQRELAFSQGTLKAEQDQEIWRLEEEVQLLREELARYTARAVQ
jgi:hypothetical protein